MVRSKCRAIDPVKFREQTLDFFRDVEYDVTRMPEYDKTVFIILDDVPMYVMQCVKCGEWKERTTEHFAAAGVRGNLDAWFVRGRPGKHAFLNCESHPCKTCYSMANHKARRQDGSDTFWQYRLSKYTQIAWRDGKQLFDSLETGPITALKKVSCRTPRSLAYGGGT